MWCRKADKDGPFGGVSEEMVNANVPAFDAAKSPSQSGRRGRCERGMALAAAVSPMAAESHGEEFGVHGDAIFYFCLCEIFGSSYADLGYYFFLHWVHNTATSYLRTYMLVTSGVSIKVTYSHINAQM